MTSGANIVLQRLVELSIFILLLGQTMACSAGTRALPNAMKDIEYHYQLKPAEFSDAPDKLSAGLAQRLPFVEWKKGATVKQGFYIDTEDRFLKQHGKVLRVRFDRNKPKKSKITLKSRGPDLDTIDALGTKAEGEIDAFSGSDQYSFALEEHFPSSQYTPQTMTPEDALDFLRTNAPNIYERTRTLREHAATSPLIKSTVMNMIKYKGAVLEGPHKGMKLELQVWTALNGKSPVLAEIGFHGKITDRTALDTQGAWLFTKLRKARILARDPKASKTELTFALQ